MKVRSRTLVSKRKPLFGQVGRRVVGLVALALVALAIALVFAVTRVSTGSGADIAAPNAEQQKVLIDQAKRVVTDYAESPVTQALVVSTTRRSISALAGYDIDQSMNPQLGSSDAVFVVTLDGNFKDYGVQGPGPGPPVTAKHGEAARVNRTQEVAGSSPASSIAQRSRFRA